MQPFADESQMRVVNAEDLWELGGIFQLDLFAQYLSQAALHTSMKSGSRRKHPLVIRDSSTGQLTQVTVRLLHWYAIRVQIFHKSTPKHTTE